MKKKIASILISLFFILGTVFIVPISVSASNYVSIPLSDISGNFSFGSSSIIQRAGSMELRVPLYMQMNFATADIDRYQYLSGYISMYSPFRSNNPFPSGSSFVFVNECEGITVRMINNTATLYFDNYHPMSMFGSNMYLGYYHYQLPATETDITYSLPTSTFQGLQSNYLRVTDNVYGLQLAIRDALNSSSDINEIIDILTDISSESTLCYNVLRTLAQNNQTLFGYINTLLSDQDTIITYLDFIEQESNNIQSDVGTILSKINTIKNDVHNIYNLLYDQSQQQQASQGAADIDTKLIDLADDIELQQPTGVADLADSYLQQIDTTDSYSLISQFYGIGPVVLMLSLVLALAVISYLLYGGR